jgi:16S rRNA (guanine966-N2)-methyltransferase
MHVIAGRLRGRRLEYASNSTLRPASQKVRAAIFNILQDRIQDARVLDIFCGTGSVGIEALSRGAAHVDFVDLDVRLVVRNVTALAVTGDVDIFRKEASAAVEVIAAKQKRYDFVFVGAPYDFPDTPKVLESLGRHGSVAPGGTLMLEHRNRTRPLERHGDLVLARSYPYGQTILSVYRPAADMEAPGSTQNLDNPGGGPYT